MAKLAREDTLRERRMHKQAKRVARRQSSPDLPTGQERPNEPDAALVPAEQAVAATDAGRDEQATASGEDDDALRLLSAVDPEPAGPGTAADD